MIEPDSRDDAKLKELIQVRQIQKQNLDAQEDGTGIKNNVPFS